MKFETSESTNKETCRSPIYLLQAGVLRTRSTEFLPLPVIIMTFVVTGLWWLYGHIIHDIYLQVVYPSSFAATISQPAFLLQIPNMLGCILASAQLSLFLIFPRKRVNDDGVQLLHVQWLPLCTIAFKIRKPLWFLFPDWLLNHQ